ncbi:unnamed protein product [Miscanthus lutarioriparius]|uniref:Protein CPR-5 n=1 Tax=Miscanthus lutarioriparius TaxID=422564 RepID=A0A811NM99_9POAL|nr:unnamed protein product [Miscanthus lutarioriparius]
MRKGMHLRRRQQVAVRGGGRAGGGDVQDLALPLGMSFVAVLAQVLNRCSGSEGRLRPDVLSKMCTSAVKESLTNIYGDRFQSFMSNFEKAFGSTLRTIHLINETPVYEQDMAQCSYKDGNSVPEIKLGGADSLPEIKLGGADSPSQIRDVQTDMPSSSMNNQIVLHAGINHQLVHLTRSRSNPEIDQHILSVFERSLNEQARSNELKELEIGLAMRKLQLSRSQLALSSDSHMLEKIKVRMGFQKASFKEKKFKTEMEDTKHAELFRKLIDMLLTAVVLMSVCFGYGTYIYSYQQITAATSACAANFKGVYILVDAKFSVSIELWFAAFQMPCDSSNKDILWNFDAPINCRCVDTLGGDGNVWLIYWEALCSIHLLGNIWPSLLHRMLYGPISVAHKTKAVHLPYWARRYTFYVLVSLILPCLAGLLPFASLSDWKELAVQCLKSRFNGSNIED